MKKTCLKSLFLLVVLLSLVITPSLHAASLSLTHIGGLATDGATYSEWWYSGTTPLLKGTAGEGADVVITVGTDAQTVTADSSGYWSYQASLAAEDYTIAINSGGESYSFTLHAGQSMSSGDSMSTTETTQSTTAVPPTGYNQIAGILGGSTLALAGVYAYLQGRKSTKKAYAKEVLKSLR